MSRVLIVLVLLHFPAPVEASGCDGVLEEASALLDEDRKAEALEMLEAHLEEHPDDCEVRSWVAWLYVDVGFPQLASLLLDEAPCEEGPMGDRVEILGLYMDTVAGEATPDDLPGIEIHEAWPEDLDLLRHTRRLLVPHWKPPVTIRAAVLSGWTTNALAGNPGDPVLVGKDTASGVFTHDVRLAYSPLALPWLSPLVEGSTRSTVFFAADAREYGSFDLGARVGLAFLPPWKATPSLFVGYRGGVLFLNRADAHDDTAPVVFHESHRGEWEVRILPSVLLFGGVGRTLLRQDARTRWELDGGVGFHGRFVDWLDLMAAGSIRGHWAEHDAYDLFGASVLAAATVHVWKGIEARASISLHLDRYVDSDGFFHPQLDRRDTTLKFGAAIASMPLGGVRFTVKYELSERFSSVPAYSYADHRILAGITLRYAFDGLGTKKARGDHVPLDYGIVVSASGWEESIQDLLRTDEEVRGGASCGCME